MNTEAQFKLLFFPMGFFFYQSCCGMKIFDSLNIYLYEKLNVPMLPLSMFLNNIAVLWIKMIREISFYFELHKVTLKTEKFSQIFFHTDRWRKKSHGRN